MAKKFKKLIPIFIITSLLFILSCEYLLSEDDTTGLSTESIIEGLKEALRTGVDIQADSAAVIDRGYLGHSVIKILLPSEANQAVSSIENASGVLTSLKKKNAIAFIALQTLFTVFLTDLDDFLDVKEKLIRSLNNSAETAAPESKEIFFAAIVDMTFKDAVSILNGSDTSATAYLHTQTYYSLKELFQPIVKRALNTVNATKYWEEFFTRYNKVANSFNAIVILEKSLGLDFGLGDIAIFNLNPVNTDLPDYTTSRALTGLFYLVGQEETSIRKDPFQYGKAILEKVFGIAEE